MNCTDCGKPLAVNPRRKGTRCQPCATRAMATSPEKRRKNSEAMKARFADPAYREEHRQRAAAGLRAAIKRDPELRARLVETGRRVGKLHGGNVSRPAGSPSRAAAARKQSEFYMGWCPLEYRDGYRQLVRSYGVKAADAKRMTLELIDADRARYLATGKLQQSVRP